VEHIQSITSVVTALAAPLAPVIAAIGLSTMFISWVKSIYDRTCVSTKIIVFFSSTDFKSLVPKSYDAS
jgi:hypothetical protein